MTHDLRRYIDAVQTLVEATTNSDYAVHEEIESLANRIIAAMEHTKPFKGFKDGKRVVLYDLRGAIRKPKLAVAFVFPMTRFALAAQSPNSPFDALILVPHLFFKSLNTAMIQSQTLLHHELAHFLLNHQEIFDDIPIRFGPAYINHPAELDANFHQMIADMRRSLDRMSPETAKHIIDDPAEFQSAFLKTIHRQVARDITDENKQNLLSRAERYRRDLLRSEHSR